MADVLGPLQDWNVFQKLLTKFTFTDLNSDAVHTVLQEADNTDML